MNEEEIENCEIKINDILIPFTYFYKFKNKGKYKIKYIFKQFLIKTDCMFYECRSLINIDLIHFNTQNVINMEGMFCGCESLNNIIYLILILKMLLTWNICSVGVIH